MNRIAQIKRAVEAVGVPVMVSGSAVMVLNGIDRQIADLDLFCTTRDWFGIYERRRLGGTPQVPDDWRLVVPAPAASDVVAYRKCDPPYLTREIEGLRVDLFFAWRHRGMGDVRVAEEWAAAEVVEGLQCIRLARLMEWKAEMRRPKDLDDIRRIAAVLDLRRAVDARVGYG